METQRPRHPMLLALSLMVLTHCHPTFREGEPINRRISHGERHSYRIDLAQEEYLRIEVTQLGVDVSLAIKDSDKRLLFTVDRPIGDRGVEGVSLLGRSRQRYFLEIKSIDDPIKTGRYRIAVVQTRPATEGDPAIMAGERDYLYAYQLYRGGYWTRSLETLQELEASDMLTESFRAEILHLKGSVLREMGEVEKALTTFRESEKWFRHAGDPAGEAKAWADTGICHGDLNDKGAALDAHYRALWLLRRGNNSTELGKTLINLGGTYLNLQALNLSLHYFEQAADTLTENRVRKAQATASAGQVYREMGMRNEAGTRFFQALALLEAIESHHVKTPSVMNFIGGLMLDFGDVEAAMDWFLKAEKIAETKGGRRDLAPLLSNIGNAYQAANQHEEAITFYKRAMALYTLGERGRAHYNLGRAQFSRYQQGGGPGELEAALASLTTALELARDKDRWLEANTLYMISAIHWYCGGTQSQAFLNRAIAIIEDVRLNLEDSGSQQSFLANKHHFYELEINLLMDGSTGDEVRSSEALAVFEKTVARNLLDVLTGGDAMQGPHDSDLLESVWRMRHELEYLQDEGQLETYPRLDKVADLLKDPFLKAAEDANPLLTPTAQGVKSFQSLLAGEDTLILEFALGTYRSYLWVISEKDIKTFTLPPKAVIEEQISEVRKIISVPPKNRRRQGVSPDPFPDLLALSRLLLGPTWPLEGISRLAIVGSGTLPLLPFEALPVPRGGKGMASTDREDYQPLLQVAEMVYLPSASVLARLRTKEKKIARKHLAIFYDPVFSTTDSRVKVPGLTPGNEEGFPRLIATIREARDILSMTSESKANATEHALEGFEARREKALGNRLADFRLLHFATHGVIDTKNPGRSSLILSQVDVRGSPISGRLSLNDIMAMNLNAELVVLSACETAFGKEIRGEGLLSLAYGFMYAGAPRVVGSLWRVADESTAVLMAEFYRNMLRENLPASTALHQARYDLRLESDWQDPYFWAGFVFIGDWQ